MGEHIVRVCAAAACVGEATETSRGSTCLACAHKEVVRLRTASLCKAPRYIIWGAEIT